MSLKAKAGVAGTVGMIAFVLATTPMVPKDNEAATQKRQANWANQQLKQRNERQRRGLEESAALDADQRLPAEHRPPPRPPKLFRLP